MAEYYLSIFVGLAIIAVMAVDLGVFQRQAHTLTMRSAIGWSIFWVLFALAFNVCIYFWVGKAEAVQFLSGYLVEKSLSVDNLFVFLMIFTYFKVPSAYQHKVLVWGILGAIIMRGILIWAGVELIERYQWLTYVLGVFLVFTGLKTAGKSEDDLDLEHKPLLRGIRRIFPVTKDYVKDRFIVRQGSKVLITPLMVVLLMIETTDVLFALDSIPAILAITTDQFVLYTSNLFAILGLRALYFVLAGLLQSFRFLSYGVSFVLIFVGVKMLIHNWVHIPEAATLSVIAICIIGSAVASVAIKPKVSEEPAPH